MTRWTERDGTIWLETRREGLLAPVGHDLRLEVGRFSVELSPGGDRIEASVHTSSVRVRAALNGDDELPDSLSRRDRAQIERKIAKEVLQAHRHPLVRFEGEAEVTETGDCLLVGQLTLGGVTQAITVTASPSAGRWTARFVLRKSDFGIRQVTALLGALKVRDEVEVIVDLPQFD